MTTLLDLFRSPEFYPIRLDLSRRIMSFVRMSKASYRRSSFLDHRTYRDRLTSADIYDVNIDDLLTCSVQVPARTNRVHYVLHGAYCCSTLMARYLELIPPSFVLKEPLILTQIAVDRARLPALWAESSRDTKLLSWAALLDLCVRLLSRSYETSDLPIIKVNDRCNAIGNRLLQYDQRSRAVFMSVKLRTFLLSVLKTERRRAWLRERLEVAHRDAAVLPVLASINPSDLTDAEGGAYLWLVNDALCRACVEADASRVMVLDGDQLAESPGAALRAVAGHFELPVDDNQLAEALAHPSVRRYSKDLSREYDFNSRRNEMMALEQRFGTEADIGLEWAANVQGN